MTMADTETDMLALARRYHEAGLAIIPPMMDGSKRPISTWKQYQERRPTPAEIKAWYKSPQDGIGCITGAVSGNLELFEFDWYNTYLEFCEVGHAAGLGELIDRISNAYSEATPGGGVHWYWRCPEISGNTKLAQRATGDSIKVLIETRGEGGFSIMAPSHGKVHAKGAYTVLKGRVEDIPTITPEERTLLFNLARTFHELHVEVRSEPRSPLVDGDRPGDLFGRQASWADILEPHGWKRIFTRGKVTHWRRPGKDIGTSATTGYTDSDTLMVFSTSTLFEPVPTSYTKFAAYALLNHKGDHGAAAKALWRDGYRNGATVERPAPVTPTPALQVDPETGEEKPERFFIWANELDELPDLEWTIEEITPSDALFGIVGGFGSRKTFVLLDMACCIATGHHWHGHDVKQGTVVYVFGEGLRGLRQRIRAWEEHYNTTVSDLAFVPRAIRLLTPEDVNLLISNILALPEKPVAVFIDTLARAMTGGDENSQKDMGILVEAADNIRRATGATVGFAHHTNRKDDYRGSSAFPGALDAMMSTDTDGDVTTLHCEKMKDWEQFEDITLLAKRVGMSLVLTSGNSVSALYSKAQNLGGDAKEALELLNTMGTLGLTWTDWKDRLGMEKGPFNNALTALKGKGLVRKNEKSDKWVSCVLGSEKLPATSESDGWE